MNNMNMAPHEKKTLAQIVSMEPEAAMIFEKYGLDYCFKGKRTMEEACSSMGIPLRTVKEELDRLMQRNMNLMGEMHFEKMELNKLADYILKKHHTYVNDMIPIITKHLHKVVDRHSSTHPELNEIVSLFHEVRMELEQHMMKEEEVLFPYIKSLEKARIQSDHHSFSRRHFIANPIHVMEAEHERAGAIMARIRDLTGHYAVPADACSTYKLCYAELKAFEFDLHLHIHLENNILFPKSIALENVLHEISTH